MRTIRYGKRVTQLDVSLDIHETTKTLRELMRIRGMDRATLASFANVNKQTVDRFLEGYTRPTSSTISALAKAMGMNLSGVFDPPPAMAARG